MLQLQNAALPVFHWRYFTLLDGLPINYDPRAEEPSIIRESSAPCYCFVFLAVIPARVEDNADHETGQGTKKAGPGSFPAG
jgi:hypothetical protein